MFRQLVKINPEIHTNLSLVINLGDVTMESKKKYTCDPIECNMLSYYDILHDSKYSSLKPISLGAGSYYDDMKSIFFDFCSKPIKLLYQCPTNDNINNINSTQANCILSKPYYINYKIYNKKFMFFAPFYITSVDDIPDVCVLDIYLISSFDKKTYIHKQLVININNRKITKDNPNIENTRLYKYLYKSLAGEYNDNTYYINYVDITNTSTNTSVNTETNTNANTGTNINTSTNTNVFNSQKISYQIKCYNYDNIIMGRAHKGINYDHFINYNDFMTLTKYVNTDINDMYANKKLYDQHIFPVSFCFNIDNILTKEEQYFFKNCEFKVNCHYANYGDDLTSLIYYNYYDIYNEYNKLNIQHVNFINTNNTYDKTVGVVESSNEDNPINETGINFIPFNKYYIKSNNKNQKIYHYNNYNFAFELQDTNYKVPIRYHKININNKIYDTSIIATNYNTITNNAISDDYDNIKINF